MDDDSDDGHECKTPGGSPGGSNDSKVIKESIDTDEVRVKSVTAGMFLVINRKCSARPEG